MLYSPKIIIASQIDPSTQTTPTVFSPATPDQPTFNQYIGNAHLNLPTVAEMQRFEASSNFLRTNKDELSKFHQIITMRERLQHETEGCSMHHGHDTVAHCPICTRHHDTFHLPVIIRVFWDRAQRFAR